MGLKEGQWGWGVRGKKFQLHHKTFLAIVLCAWKPHAHVRVRLLTRTVGKNLKIQPPRGLGGYPNFFFTPNLIFFVTRNAVQNFKIVAQLLLGLFWLLKKILLIIVASLATAEVSAGGLG